MRSVTGLHHVTAIAGNAQENLDFYAGVLGMRLVKRSVNQDDPHTYHLFYADAAGSPGSDLTFFPWEQLAPSLKGHGLSVEVALALPEGALDYWYPRRARYGVPLGDVETRFGDRTLRFVDPHGLELALVESASGGRRPFEAWHESPVSPDVQIRGLESTRLYERQLAPTLDFLTAAFGLELLAEEADWQRWGLPGGGSGRYLDVQETPLAPRGRWGTGAIHHVAWRVDDEEHELAVREQIAGTGMRPTPVIDRFWFRSVYAKEPGGALYEIATDGPGFGVDEAMDQLGQALVLPPWLESERADIEQALPVLDLEGARERHRDGDETR